MAEAHKFTTLDKAIEAFGDSLPWQASNSKVWIFDSKEDDYVPVEKGQFIYHVGSRYEVRDSEELPATVKPALPTDEKPVEKAVAAKEESKAESEDK
jgi:hypothetical protein